MANFKSPPTDWQAIQDNYNAMNDISIPFRADPEDVIEPEQSMTPVQVQDRVPPQQNNANNSSLFLFKSFSINGASSKFLTKS